MIGNCKGGFCVYAISTKISSTGPFRDVPTYTQIRMCVQLGAASRGVLVTEKPVLSGNTKIDKNDLNT